MAVGRLQPWEPVSEDILGKPEQECWLRQKFHESGMESKAQSQKRGMYTTPPSPTGRSTPLCQQDRVPTTTVCPAHQYPFLFPSLPFIPHPPVAASRDHLPNKLLLLKLGLTPASEENQSKIWKGLVYSSSQGWVPALKVHNLIRNVDVALRIGQAWL